MINYKIKISFLLILLIYIVGCTDSETRSNKIDQESKIVNSKFKSSEPEEGISYTLTKSSYSFVQERLPKKDEVLELEYLVKIFSLRDTIKINLYSKLVSNGWNVISGRKDFELIRERDWKSAKVKEIVRAGRKVIKDQKLVYKVKPSEPLYVSNGKGFINVPYSPSYIYESGTISSDSIQVGFKIQPSSTLAPNKFGVIF